MKITGTTKPIFLLGHPISHSKSPLFQNYALSYLKIDTVYIALNINEEDFDIVVPAFKKLELLGLNITLPYKTEILKYIDELSEEAKEIGSVNTIKVKENKWIGYNTDWYGIFESLKIKKIPQNLNVLIIGAGGTTPAIIFGLKKYGIKNITVTNRTLEKAEILAEKFKINFIDYYKKEKELENFQLIFNSTSTDFNKLIGKLNKKCIYYDINYYKDKLKTKNYIDGTLMLLLQGKKAIEIWTGKSVPLKILIKSLKRN